MLSDMNPLDLKPSDLLKATWSALHQDVQVELDTYLPPLSRKCLGLSEDPGHPDPLRLSDGKPVCDAPWATVQHWFWNGQNHRWPSEMAILRLARYLDMPFERAVALAVKRQFERAFHLQLALKLDESQSKKVSDNRPCGHFSSSQMRLKAVKFSEKDFVLGAVAPDMGLEALFEAFQELSGWAQAAGYDFEAFRDLVESICRAGGHLIPSRSPEMERFVKNQRTQLAKLNAAEDEARDGFYRWKLKHQAAEDGLAAELLRLEETRLMAAKVDQRWLAVFGDLYLARVDTNYNVLRMEKQTALAEADPSLTQQAVEERAAEALVEALRELNELGSDVALARLLATPGAREMLIGRGIPATEAELKEHAEACKALLTKIHLRTHPDYVNSAGFTDEQRTKLRAYFEEAQELNQLLRRYRGDEALVDLVPLGRLQGILARVESLWDGIGLDVDATRQVIPGKTLTDQNAWLEQDTVRLERDIRAVRAQIRALTEDKQLSTRIASLASEEAKADTRAQLQAQLEAAQAQLAALEARWAERFPREAA